MRREKNFGTYKVTYYLKSVNTKLKKAFQMKSSAFLLFFVALLLGSTVFGIYKSFELSRENDDLSQSVVRLTMSVTSTEDSLRATQKSLDESRLKNDALGNELKGLKSLFAEKETQIQEDQKNLALLVDKLKEAVGANDILNTKNKELTDQTVRLQFENGEMKETVSSIEGLKKAIKELKAAQRQAKNVKKVPRPKKEVQKKKVELFTFENVPQVVQGGNQGFMVKDGKATLEEKVDIKVIPIESGNP